MTPEREASDLIQRLGHKDAYNTAYKRLEATTDLGTCKHLAAVCNVILMASERLQTLSTRN